LIKQNFGRRSIRCRHKSAHRVTEPGWSLQKVKKNGSTYGSGSKPWRADDGA